MSLAAAQSAALEYLGRGWSVFPLLGKVARIAWKEEGCQDKLPARETVTQWWQAWPDAGIGLALGPVSGIVRLDAEGCDAEEMLGKLPDTAKFKTRSGYGWLFKYEDGANTLQMWKGDGDHQELRLQSKGAYCVLPPSAHPDGGNYEWLADIEPAPLPASIRDKILADATTKELARLEKEIGGGPPDKGVVLDALAFVPADFAFSYETWIQVGMALHSVDSSMLSIWDDWSQKCPEKYKPGECEAKWRGFKVGNITGRSILHWAKLGGWTPTEHARTDIGTAERLVSKYGENMKFCHAWGKWLIWDGKKWNNDDTGAASKLAIDHAKSLMEESRDAYTEAAKAALADDSGDAQGKKIRAKALYEFATKSQQLARVNAALTLAQPYVPVLPKVLDIDPWALNCDNGILNLKTMELRPHHRDELLTKLCPTPYNCNAPCPLWYKFLKDVFHGNEATITWVQKLLGYCLTGCTTEHILPIFWGSGANGKSTMLGTLAHVLGGDYSSKAPRELLISTRQTGHPTAIASLFGKRLVAAVETGDGARLDEVAVKELTGNDELSCRRMYEDFWTFIPTHKIVLATNHRPEVRGTDHAIWRRIKLVPFTRTFTDAEKDVELPNKLQKEAAGILRWMADGCLLWQREGLGEPAEVSEATSSYRAESDRMTEFLDAHYTPSKDGKVRIGEMMAKYTIWAVTNKEMKLSGQAFGRAMSDRGYERDASRKYYRGLIEVVT